ncbi:MAG TPA: hypothetical protein VF046_11600 [Gemmatimonadales bacterium]
MKWSVPVAVLLMVGTASSAGAQGGPPLRTDDPGTPGPGRWEVNTAVTLEHVRGETSFEAPLADINYGVGDRIQLKVEMPLELIDQRNRRLDTGLGNPSLGVKWRFAEDTASGFAVSTYPQLELVSPVRTDAARLEGGGTSLLLPVEVTTRLGSLDINAEVGYQLVAHTSGGVLYGLAVGREVSDRLELAAECHATNNASLSEQITVCSAAARDGFTDHLTLLAALGHGITGPRDERPTVAMYLGLQTTW